MRFTNSYRLPLPVLRMAEAMEHEVPVGAFSVTELIDSPRRVQLKRRKRKFITVDVMDMVFSLLGTAFHQAMEDHTQAAAEDLITATLDGQTISGKPDLIKNGKITDWKVTSAWSYVFGRPEWEQQTNIYRWLARENGILITGAEIVALFRDWTEKHTNNPDYPQHPMVRIPIELWPIDYTIMYIKERVDLHRSAAELPDDELPLCTNDERWLRGASWAVYKKKSHKRAKRLFKPDDYDDPETAAREFV